MRTDLISRSPTEMVVRGKIDSFEGSLKESIASGKMVQTIVDCKEDNSQAKHYFGENVYCRSLLIPAGTSLVGYIHKQDRVCIIAQGKCTFVDEFQGRKTVEAPYIGEFKAGSKTAVYAHTDTLWVACLGTELTNEDIMVDQLVTGSHKSYEEFVQLQLGVDT